MSRLENFKGKGGHNLNTFSSENQPAIKGRKKVSHVLKIMRAMGKNLAPQDLREDETVKEFLEANDLKGTVNEVLIARLYTLALYKGDLKAIKLIVDTLTGKYWGSKHKGQHGIQINFITPPVQEAPIDITNDSWSIQPPAESKSD